MSNVAVNTKDPIALPASATRGISILLLVIGAVFLLGSLWYGVQTNAEGKQEHVKYFAHAYLWAFMYFYTIMAGGLFWTMLHHATNGGWGTLIRRQSENLAWMAPVMAFLFLPLFFLREKLWKWIDPAKSLVDEAFIAKQAYFTFPGAGHGSFFYTRLLFFFAFWIGAAYFFRRMSMKQDENGSIVYSSKMQKWSYGFIPLFAICITFSAIDWVMALDYHWYSTMWGVYLFAGTAGSSMATMILVILALKSRSLLGLVNKEHLHIMGKLLFAFTVFWAYIAFSQYMLIWYANIPEETLFFEVRNVGTWRYVAILLVICRFAIPFLLLLTQGAKQTPWRIGLAAGWVLTWHAVDHYWMIMPLVQTEGWHPHFLDLAIWLGMAAVLVSFFLRAISSANLYPIRDPRLAESIHLKN
jgi:hypothetical protein